MNINIRNIELSDFYNYKKHINSDISNEYFDNFVNNILNDNHHILVIEYENIIVGSGTLLIEEKMTYGGCKMGHIENILIDENMRGKKLGTLLIHELIKIADQKKCYRVDLGCENFLKKFYKSVGFNDSLICMTLLNKHHFK
jgi:glucosamine-phosphate N-acetyltransferase